jgi:hypothetical protein
VSVREREREGGAQNLPSLDIEGCGKERGKESERAWGLNRCGIITN